MVELVGELARIAAESGVVHEANNFGTPPWPAHAIAVSTRTMASTKPIFYSPVLRLLGHVSPWHPVTTVPQEINGVTRSRIKPELDFRIMLGHRRISGRQIALQGVLTASRTIRLPNKLDGLGRLLVLRMQPLSG